MDSLVITDVAPRDGLQNQDRLIGTAGKLQLIDRLAAAGVGSVEATSFVSPSAVPQMADAADVIRGLADRALRVSALVPNTRGLQRALEAGVREIAVVLAATDTMNRRNINMSLAQAVAVSAQTLTEARAAGLATRAYVAVAFECPFEGRVAPAGVIGLARAMREAGADEIVIADTIGAAGPFEVTALLDALAAELPLRALAVHFHDTRGMGLANAYAALSCGVRRFDASVGGIGGCPFAPGAAGNLATEDLVLLAHRAGLHTGIRLRGLAAAVDHAEQLLGRPLGGRSTAWLRRHLDRLEPDRPSPSEEEHR